MIIQIDVLIFILTTFISFSSESPCKIAVQCPCGSKDNNITSMCVEDDITKEPCNTWPGCVVCIKAQECLKCPGDFTCPEATTRKRKLRQKRGYTIRQRQGSSCPDLEVPEAGNIRCFNSATKRTCTGSCIPGHLFENRESESEIELTCQNGVWSPLKRFPPCKSSGQCNLVVISTGDFNCTSDNKGTRCDVYCSSRYEGQFQCYPGQSWSPPLPRCVVQKEAVALSTIMCPDPGQVPNADRFNGDQTPSLSPQQYRVGQSVLFICRDGFALQHRSLITCTSSGTWSNRPPICIVVSGLGSESPPEGMAPSTAMCPNPGQVPNSDSFHADGTPSSSPLQYSVGQSILFICHDGFALQHRSHITCTSSGTWSDRLPICIRVADLRTEAPSDASLIVYCENPGPLPNAIITHFPPFNGRVGRSSQIGLDDPMYPQGSRLKYSCEDGYALEGDGMLICESSGMWSSNSPACTMEEVRYESCYNPGPILNGQALYLPAPSEERKGPIPIYEIEDFSQGASLQYACDSGYTLEGVESLTCESSGIWSANPPSCSNSLSRENVVYCGGPIQLPNAAEMTVIPPPSGQGPRLDASGETNEYPEGTILRYSCDDGYEMLGHYEVTCKDSSFWSPFPTCRQGL